MPRIGYEIKDFTGVVQDADLEDIAPEDVTVLKNFRVVRGKLKKTSGLGGEKLDSIMGGSKAMVTWINSNLASGYMYLLLYHTPSNRELVVYGWTGSQWSQLQDIAELSSIDQAGLTTNWRVADNYENPIVQHDGVIRFLPGDIGEYSGEEAKGVWLGYIDRDFFDGNYSPTADFYNYAVNCDKPSITLDVQQHDGDSAFNPLNETAEITDLSEANDTVTILGEWVGYFPHDSIFEIYGNTTNYGKFKVADVEIDTGNTVIQIDTSYKDFSGAEDAGYVKFSSGEDEKFYRLSYLYDGVQESLLSDDAVHIAFGKAKFAEFNFEITEANHNNRITALNIYRAATRNGDYKLVSTVDFLRDSGKYVSNNGLALGRVNIYIPGLSGTTTGQDPAGTGKIKLWNKQTHGWDTFTTSSYAESTTRVVFGIATSAYLVDYWDVAWEYYTDSGDSTAAASGSSGAYAGLRTAILPAANDLGLDTVAGGVLNYGFDSGDWDSGRSRLIDDSYKRAVHLTSDMVTASESWTDADFRILQPENGLYVPESIDTGAGVSYKVFDTNLTEGESHPLQGEVSIKVNGKFARIVNGRLWQANIVLDPGGENEEHPEWAAYSELDQYDVRPVSNVIRFPDREGGGITGLEELFGRVVVLKKQSIQYINTKSYPNRPELWSIDESPHNIGNIAPRGAITVMDRLYVCSKDGIYQISPSNLAESDATPTERLKVTTPIENIYNAMTYTQKTEIKSIYNQTRNEVIFCFTYTSDGTDYDVKWAYHIGRGTWRELYSTVTADLLALDEEAEVMVYDDTNNKVYSLDESDSDARSTVRSKWFVLHDRYSQPVTEIYVTYKSPHALKLKLYVDYNSTASAEYDLPAQANMAPYRITPRVYAKRVAVEITDDHGSPLTVEATDTSETYLIVELGEATPTLEISGLGIFAN